MKTLMKLEASNHILMLFQLRQAENLQDISQDNKHLQALITFVVTCGAHTVARAGAFPALPTFLDISDNSFNYNTGNI